MDKKKKGKDKFVDNDGKSDGKTSKAESKGSDSKLDSKPSTAATKKDRQDDKPSPKKKPRNRLPPISDARSVVEMGTGQDTELDMRKSFTAPDHAKTCYFYKEQDYTFSGVKIPVNPRKYKKWDVLLLELSKKIPGLGFGVRSVYTPGGSDAISNLDGLTHDGKYVCSSNRNRCRPLNINRVHHNPSWFMTRPPSGRRAYNDILKEDVKYRDMKVKRVKRDYDMTSVYNRNQPKKVTILRNGEPTNRHVMLFNRKTAQNFEQILKDLSDMFKTAIWRLYTIEGRRILSLGNLFSGPDVLIAAGREPFRNMEGSYDSRGSQATSRNFSRTGMGTRGSDMVASRMKTRRDRLANTKGRWRVNVITNKNRHAGTQAQVTLTVYGHKGNSGPISLGTGDGENFQSGTVDEFDVNVGNVGEVYKIRIGHDDSGDSPGWLCDEVKMFDIDTSEELTFTCHRWMARDEDDGEITREIAAIRKGEPILPAIRYEVTCVTGDLWNAGTDANVYITIYGDRGDTGVRQLYSKDKVDLFKKGKTNKFTVEAVSLGHLKRIIVGHDGTGNGNGWYLEKISIKESTRQHEENNFYCGKWLDEGEDDGKIVRELKIQEEYMDDILEKRNWEQERWKFEKDCRVKFYSLASGKALRAKKDMSVDGLGIQMDPESIFNVSLKKAMIRMFNSVRNPNHYLAIDNGKITMLGKGGPFCEFRIRVQGDGSVILESVKNPLQFVTVGEDGHPQDVRAILDKEPSRRFFVYCKGIFRHRGTVLLNTSSSQCININSDFTMTGTGKKSKGAHFMVHKVDTGGVRMFESIAHPGKYIRLKDGKIDCLGSRDEASHFIVEKHPEEGSISLQSASQRGLYLGLKPDGRVWPTVDTGVRNTSLFPEVIEFGVPKSKSTELIEEEEMGREETPVKPKPEPIKKDFAVYVTDDMDTSLFGDGDWSIQVSTLESLDENADVALVVYGDLGQSGSILLGAPPGKKIFTAGNNDEFRANLSKVGNIYKIRLELIPRSTADPSWKVKDVKMIDLNTNETLVFPFSKWLSKVQEDRETMREQPVRKNGEPVLPLVRYHVILTTGKEPGSETDSNVYINIAGEKGDTGRRMLLQSNNVSKFKVGQTDIFHVEAVSLGVLQKLTIGHDGTMAGQGWYLDEVVIREFEDAKEEYIFPCEKWLDTGEEDRKIERVLYVKEPAPCARFVKEVREVHPSIEPEVSTIQEEEEEPPKEEETIVTTEGEWKLWVTTGGKEDMSTLNRVMLYVYGSNNVAGPMVLGSGKEGHFQAGATDEFKVNLGGNLGDIYKIRIGHDEEKDNSGWFVENVKLQDLMVNSKTADLSVNRWMSRQQEDCDVWREIPVTFFDKPLLPVVVYTVEVYTGEQQQSACTSRVSILMSGEIGDSGKRRLYQSSEGNTPFNTGSKDVFKIEAVSLSNLEEITISHDNHGDYAELYLDKVIISVKDEQFYFPCDRWLTQDDGDGKCEVTLKPKPMPKESKGEYRLSIKTAEDSLPANGGSVTFVLYGDVGRSEEIKLFSQTSTTSLFEPGNIDKFEIITVSGTNEQISAGELGELYKIRLTKQDIIQWEGWHLLEIKMQDVETDEEYTFHCDRWLSRDKEDFDVVREFPISRKTGSTPQVKIYEVSIHTGNNWGAETDASVFINIFGTIGDTSKRLLYHSKNNSQKFQRGQIDLFEIEAVSLENLTHIEIGHDRKGHGAGMYLDKVVISEKDDSAKEYVFPCHAWLDDREGDGKTWKTLPVLDVLDTKKAKPKIDSSKSAGKWKNVQVTVKTSDLDNAGTEAQVFLTAYGDKGQSDKLSLTSPDSAHVFAKGAESEINVSFGDIGELTKIRLEHDGTSKHPSWHVDWVKLTAGDNDEVMFYINKWFAIDEEDGQILREFSVINSDRVPQPSCQYIIIIETGSKTNASASKGAVYMNLIGNHSDTGLRRLNKSLTSNSQPWKPKQEDIYMIESISVGQIEKIHVRFEGMGIEEWFLDRISIFDKVSAISKSIFNCYTLLSTETDQISVNKEFDLSETMPVSCPSEIVQSLYKDIRPQVSRGNWTVWIHCGPDSNGGTKDEVHMIVYGLNGQSKPIQLNDKMEFNQRSIVKTDITIGDIGAIFKVRLYFGGDYTGSPWFLSSLKMKDHDTLQEVIMRVDKELVGTEENPDGSLELPVTRPDLSPLEEDEFTLYVATGNQDMADTEADVFCCLIGQFGDTGRRMLSKSNSPIPFKQGQVDEFVIKSLDLGKVEKVVIGHNEKGRGRGWFCERVQIKSKLHPVMKIFPCNRWMDTGCEDRKLMRELPYIGDMPVVAPPSGTSKGVYTCTVTTADRERLPPKGLDRSEKSRLISLMVYGSQSVVGPIELDKAGADLFLPGHVDVFKGLSIDVGEIKKIRVCAGYEEDPESVWTTEKIELEDDDTKDIFTFDFSHWVGEVKGDCRKELPVLRLGKGQKQIYPYHVEVHTSEEEMNAATNSQVFITLYGMLGDSGRRLLSKSRNNKTKFQTGQIDIFTVHAVDLGELEKVVVTKGPGNPWLLEKVVVKTSDFAAQESIFSHNEWIGKKSDAPAEIEETIRLTAVQNSHVVIPALGSDNLPISKGRWKLTAETGGNKGEENFGDIVMILCGEDEETQPVKIVTTKEKPFQIGQTDVFDAKFSEVIEELYKIRLGFKDNTSNKGWLIKKIKCEDLDTGDKFSYEVKDWMVVDEYSDGWKEVPAAWPAINIPKVQQYQIKTYTGDVRSAGTDSDVYIYIHGELGTTGRRLLKKSKTHDDKFERNQEDLFVVEAVSLGKLKKVVIGHNDEGLGSGWFLQMVVITESETATEEIIFPCDQWLSKEEGDGKIERTLIAKRPGSETYRLRDRTPSSKVRPKIPTPVVEEKLESERKSKSPEPESKPKTPTPLPQTKSPTPETQIKSPLPNPLVNTLPEQEAKTESNTKTPTPEPKDKSPSPEPKAKSPSPEPKGKSPSPEPKLKSPSPEPKGKSPSPEPKGKSPSPEPKGKSSSPEPGEVEVKTEDDAVKIESPRYEEQQPDEPVRSPSPETTEPLVSPKPETPKKDPVDGDFKVTVVTSGQSKGFDDQVYLTVFGDAGNSGQLPLGEPGTGLFQAGTTDIFPIKLELEELGETRKIRLEHSDVKPGAGWAVDKIILEDLFRGDSMEFPVNKNLTLADPGSDISVEIPAHHKNHVWPESSGVDVNQYVIEVETGDEEGAETSEVIHVNLFGTLGDSGKRYLIHNKEKRSKFQRGQTDTFIIEAVDLGRLEALIVGHHGHSPSSAWFLEKVSVKESVTDTTKYIFPCGSWLRDDNDLGVAELELYMDRVEKEDQNNNADETDGANTEQLNTQNDQSNKHTEDNDDNKSPDNTEDKNSDEKDEVET
ncbi:lipoxygenase homology domain-containing protein 1-like isoform X1 [Mytilus edulis]|uniref:lipoxygenase homology domain-containing protein 1-like isoform X1 n=1 Tax=Mytilus edulis TaxID=6550 RepID=UPI0039EE8902